MNLLNDLYNELNQIEHSRIISSVDIQRKIYNQYKQYKKNKTEESINKICDITQDQVITEYQRFLENYFQRHIYKGILIYAMVGGGKTLSSILMANEYKKRNPEMNIIVLVPASLRVNYSRELNKWAPGQKDDYQIYGYNHISIIKNLPNIDNSLIIIDEIQNVISMIANKSSIGLFLYKKLIAAQNSKIITLSATPSINSPYEYAILFNILKEPRTFTLDPDLFATRYYNDFTIIDKNVLYEKISGIVSFYKGLEGSVAYPSYTTIIEDLSPYISENQRNIYNKIYEGEDEKRNKKKFSKKKKMITDYDIAQGIVPMKTIDSFNILSRIASNWVNEPLDNDDLHLHSIKFVRVLQHINNSSGKVLVYSSFVEHSLEKLQLYLNKYNIKSLKWIGGISDASRNSILNKFNNDNNIRGEKYKVLLVSMAGVEGISLTNVRQVHIIEPHWNEIKIIQVIGRAIRLCSHYTLPEEERNVKVYRYLATEMDKRVQGIADAKYKLVTSFEELLKEGAIDCYLNKEVNNISKCFEEN